MKNNYLIISNGRKFDIRLRYYTMIMTFCLALFLGHAAKSSFNR